MIRWPYVLPRLLILSVICLFVCFALDPLLRYSAIMLGQQATGARVDIDHLVSSLPHSAIRINDIQIADPEDPDSNLVQTQQIVLKFDPRELLHRRYVVEHGQIIGIELHGSRTESGALDEQPTGAESGDSLLGDAGQQLLEGLTGQAEKEFEALQTVRLSRELAERWPVEYSALEERADNLQRDIQELEQLAKTARDNPLRGLQNHQQLAERFKRLGQTPREIRGELDRLKTQLQADRAAMQEAKRQDTEHIRQRLQFNPLDGEALAEQLIGKEWTERLAKVTGWIGQIRATIPGNGQPAVLPRRGEDILFNVARQRPDMLIRKLLIEGKAKIGDRPVQFAGVVNDFTPQPKRHDKPALVRLQTSGAVVASIHATIDSTGDVTTTDIAIDCPHFQQPSVTLGSADSLAVTAAAGEARVWGHVKLIGDDHFQGQIIYKRDQISLVPKLNDRYSKQLLTDGWQSAFHDVQNLHAVVDLTGQLASPQWKLKTNLGPQLTAGFNGVVQQELDARRTRLIDRLNRESAAGMTQLTELVEQRSAALRERLTISESSINNIEAKITQGLKLPTMELTERLLPGTLNRK